MVCFPFCKINLGLNVVARRTDGFHEIETCFFPIPWTDALEVIPADTISFSMSGLTIPDKPEVNLCMRAYYLLQQQYSLPAVSMHLHKVLPLGAGLGGGSSDGAHMLLMLNDLFHLNLSEQQLQQSAAQLGSDCAFFLHDAPMLGTGRGELLSPIPVELKGKYIVIAKPDVSISTAAAYQHTQPEKAEIPIREALARPVLEWRDCLKNDFEPYVLNNFPVTRCLKEEMYAAGAMYASLSGSGSAVYGIFDMPVEMKNLPERTVYWSGYL